MSYGQFAIKLNHKRGVFLFGTMLVIIHWLGILVCNGNHKFHVFEMLDGLIYPIGFMPRHWWMWLPSILYSLLWTMFIISLVKAYLHKRDRILWTSLAILGTLCIYCMANGGFGFFFNQFSYPISSSQRYIHGSHLIFSLVLFAALWCGIGKLIEVRNNTGTPFFRKLLIILAGIISISVPLCCVYDGGFGAYWDSLPFSGESFLFLKWLHLASLVSFISFLIFKRNRAMEKKENQQACLRRIADRTQS